LPFFRTGYRIALEDQRLAKGWMRGGFGNIGTKETAYLEGIFDLL